MRRKDTQVYRKLIKKYCDLRQTVERNLNLIHENNEKILEKNLLKLEQTDSRVIAEIDNNIRILEITNYFASTLLTKEHEMKQCEEILINEYGDNPDIIYKNNKYNF